MAKNTQFFRGFCHVLLVTAAGLVLSAPAGAADEKKAKSKAPQVEVVFCLDTTGSMTGLIEGAKQKIWAISNQIASGKPTPRLKIGLVAYRDRGDVYITKVIDLTDDLDAIHGHLQGFKAEAGGDFPESVNQALNESVTRIKWSTDKETLRIIFLVGDAPPHMDYKDDVKYPVTCKLAQEKGIIINAVQCGDHPETRKYWEEICRKGGGSYVQIAANGGVVAIATPFDKELAKINAELARTTLVYGDRALQRRGEMKKADAAGLAAPAAAERAAFAGKAGYVATYDLLDSIKAKKVKLEDIKKEHLPPELHKLTLKEQKAYLDKLAKRRAELAGQILELDKKRAGYIKEQLAKDKKKKDGFDQQVLIILQKQAQKAKIEFKD
jgi:Mg-chelatase subunit ChlD